jgi:membrane protein DedA with SNARE-associated domain
MRSFAVARGARIMPLPMSVSHLMNYVALFGLDIEHVSRWFEVGGYFVLFGLLFACGLGLPLPEDVPLLLGGFAVAQGKMHLLPVCILAWCGIIGGDCMLYSFGKRYGLNITRVPMIGKHVTRERIERAEKLFERWGVWVVAVGRLLAGIRGAMVVAAGTIRFNFIKFIIADGLAALVSGGLWIWLGHWVGKKMGNIEDIEKNIAPYKHWVTVGTAVLVILAVAYIWWRSMRHKTISEALAEEAAGE